MAWQKDWLRSAASARRDLWRGVEAQHRVATMRLVDDLAEQEQLERLLDASKPRAPGGGTGHYLLFTPFRYISPWPSRFRLPHQPGAWYGADEPETVAAEIAHWRWKFLMESESLRGGELLCEFTFFQARFNGIELDITQEPWSSSRRTWRHHDNYTQCHALATAARAAAPAVQAIRYESARREGGMCGVVFDVASLSVPKSGLMQQTWSCKTTRERVLLSHEGERLQFDMG